ncbi:hypothetical protein H0H81_005514 [Sphagnurus paluster]|uniref:Uncharacterized protein n=1 Tax=Sphagnurus paluster TaxID=117069 RepID=A0A9P7KL29_9AGAR|nr:hypothetical protein H0H81_005514 [Sphagnurus paluster]
METSPNSMAAVLTTSMSLRIILSVRGSLAQGGSFALSANTTTNSSRTTHVISTRGAVPTNISTHGQTYTLDVRSKTEADWASNDKASESEAKPTILDSAEANNPGVGVKITIDREIGYDDSFHHAK